MIAWCFWNVSRCIGTYWRGPPLREDSCTCSCMWKPENPVPATLEEKSILTSNCKSACKKARALGEFGKGSSQGETEGEEGGETLPSIPALRKAQPPKATSPPRAPHLAHLDSYLTFTPIPSTSSLPPAQILALKNLKFRVLFPYSVSLSHIQSCLSCVTAKGWCHISLAQTTLSPLQIELHSRHWTSLRMIMIVAHICTHLQVTQDLILILWAHLADKGTDSEKEGCGRVK